MEGPDNKAAGLCQTNGPWWPVAVSVIEAVAHEIGTGLEVHRVFGDIG